MNEINTKKQVQYVVKFPQSNCGFSYIKKKQLFESLKVDLMNKGYDVSFQLLAEKGISELNIYETKGENTELLFSSGQGDHFHSFLQDGSNRDDLIEKLLIKTQEINSFK